MSDSNVKKGETVGATSINLLERLKGQDQEAWRRVVRLYGPLIYYWCRLRGLQAADAADVGQKVFAAVAGHIGDFRRDQAGHTFRGWLRTIAENKIRDFFRKKHREPEGIGGSDAQRAVEQLPADDASSLDNAGAVDERVLLLRRAMDLVRLEFEERSWQIFWKTEVEGQSVREVAAELGVSEPAVYTARSRIRRRLRDEFADLIDGTFGE